MDIARLDKNIDSGDLEFASGYDCMDFVGGLMEGLSSSQIAEVLDNVGYKPQEPDNKTEDRLTSIYNLFFADSSSVTGTMENLLKIKSILTAWMNDGTK